MVTLTFTCQLRAPTGQDRHVGGADSRTPPEQEGQRPRRLTVAWTWCRPCSRASGAEQTAGLGSSQDDLPADVIHKLLDDPIMVRHAAANPSPPIPMMERLLATHPGTPRV
jgi:hypothetical protein